MANSLEKRPEKTNSAVAMTEALSMMTWGGRRCKTTGGFPTSSTAVKKSTRAAAVVVVVVVGEPSCFLLRPAPTWAWGAFLLVVAAADRAAIAATANSKMTWWWKWWWHDKSRKRTEKAVVEVAIVVVVGHHDSITRHYQFFATRLCGKNACFALIGAWASVSPLRARRARWRRRSLPRPIAQNGPTDRRGWEREKISCLSLSLSLSLSCEPLDVNRSESWMGKIERPKERGSRGWWSSLAKVPGGKWERKLKKEQRRNWTLIFPFFQISPEEHQPPPAYARPRDRYYQLICRSLPSFQAHNALLGMLEKQLMLQSNELNIDSTWLE